MSRPNPNLSKPVIGSRYHDHKILWTLTRRLNGELRVASRVKAGVPAHRLLETLLVFGGNVGSVVQRVEARIAALQSRDSTKR